MLSHEEAIEYILRDIDPHFDEETILSSLRPFDGVVKHNLFQKYVEAILSLPPVAGLEGVLVRDLITAIWDISKRVRLIALAPKGMLQRNNLISKEDISALTLWNEAIERCGLAWAYHSDYERICSGYLSYILSGGVIPDCNSCCIVMKNLLEHISNSDLDDLDNYTIDCLKCIAILQCDNKEVSNAVVLFADSKNEEIRYIVSDICGD
ncbi:hypothetical protein Pla110_09620 [Polystyrenella longa]|uniref:Uncharacterized protein n=1 Tax=Polystyrenella longa TaxID=2528007 RepID=A0A518CJ46_9PLAN|nr:hypothetical protein [Polystyrenella longa]QDU79256.1 hypothetical protein Pla110_09620 [Polystyrenella longa]